MTEMTIAEEEHRAHKGPVELFVWRKRLAQEAGKGWPPIILVHGSSLSSQPNFDLEVPGQPDYSFMNWLARRGHDVWTFDHEGYGRSSMTDGNSDIASGVEDLKVVSDLIREKTGATRVNLYGLSSGALRAGAFAAAAPDRVARLALDAFVWTGEGSPTLIKRRENVEYFRTHKRRPIDEDFIKSIFTRDLPGTSSTEMMEACAAAQISYSDSVPTGTYLDMTTKLPVVDPADVTAPTLIVRGEHDGIATMEDLLEFFRRLPTGDKRLAVLPGLAHVTPLGLKRHVMWNLVAQFLE